MEKLEILDLNLKKFQEEIDGLIRAENYRKFLEEEYLEDLSKVDPRELKEADEEMFYFIKNIKMPVSEKDSGSYMSKFKSYKQEVKESDSESRLNFASYLADQMMAKL